MLKELIQIQNELKAPKGQYNSFGKYKYRSAEDILEAVKPLLNKYDCQLTLSDSIEHIGDRYYVTALARIQKGDQSEYVTAFAREEESKKGQDGSQITGTASSYARKYALNGLFLIDDTKDADTDENKRERQNRASQSHSDEDRKITEAEAQKLRLLAKAHGQSGDELLEELGVERLGEVTLTQYASYIKRHNSEEK